MNNVQDKMKEKEQRKKIKKLMANFAQDVRIYKQSENVKQVPKECVGSSAMAQKVNPIDLKRAKKTTHGKNFEIK